MTMTENSQKPENTEIQSTQNSAELRDGAGDLAPKIPRTKLLSLPEWWRPGLPLPHLTAITTYTGTGKLRSGGRVTTTTQAVGWDWDEYRKRPTP